MVPPKYTFSYEMKGCPPRNHQKLYISVNLDQKGPEIYAYLACKIIFLGNGSQELEIHILL